MPNSITPPPELAQQWMTEFYGTPVVPGEASTDLATRAAQWGADQELEACVSYVDNNISGNKARALRAIRRPKPPSLKEQALKQLGCIQTDLNKFGMGVNTDTIRRALEALPE